MADINKFTLQGTGLKGSEIKDKSVLSMTWDPKLEYAWDMGTAVGSYIRSLKDGKLIGRKCVKCGRTMIPPRMFCELCFRPTDEWVTLKDTGKVNAFSLCRVNWDASRLPEGAKPHMPAVIEIDGASPGMGILHILGGVEPKDVKIGMSVKAVWKAPSERLGAITDIKFFKPC